MATFKIPGDQNYLKGCVICQNQKSLSFSVLDLTVSELHLKTSWGANLPPPPSKIGLMEARVVVSRCVKQEIGYKGDVRCPPV